MSTFQTVLSAFAAIVAAFFVTIAEITNNSKAIGVAVIPAILLSWQCWLLAAFCFFLFFAASRIRSKALKVLLFWVPVTAVSVLGGSYVALLTYVFIHFRNG